MKSLIRAILAVVAALINCRTVAEFEEFNRKLDEAFLRHEKAIDDILMRATE